MKDSVYSFSSNSCERLKVYENLHAGMLPNFTVFMQLQEPFVLLTFPHYFGLRL
jgi:hypothetical protein